MTALAPPVDDTPRPASSSRGSRLARLRALPAALRASEYLSVGAGRRFRAAQRRRTRMASRVVFVVVAAINVLDATYLIGLGAPNVGPAIAFDGLVMTAALVAWWHLPRRLYHHPDAAAFVIILGITVTTVASGTLAPALAVQTVGYLLVLPTLVALVMPWRTIVHIRWLLLFTGLAAAYVVVGSGMRFSLSERSDLTIVLLVTIGASLIGHVLLQRGQIRAFAQMDGFARFDGGPQGTTMSWSAPTPSSSEPPASTR